MECPRCRVPLKASDLGEYGFVIIDICPSCRGAWFDKGELDRLDGSDWTATEDLEFRTVAPDHPPANCPRCSATLVAVSPKDAPSLILDRCGGCHGFWLDEGELDKVDDMTGALDTVTLGQMKIVQRPPEWSWWRWTVYRFKRYYLPS